MPSSVSSAPPLSIVIPTYLEEQRIGETLRRLKEELEPEAEIVVSDCGSPDETAALARAAGARVVEGPRGRGTQIVTGAAAAKGDWLLFLHADTRPAEGWRKAAADFMAEPANARRAAVFRFTLDDPGPQARRVERLTRWRGRRLGLPYGDQGLLISRAFYDEIGGHKPFPMMEDIDLMRRIGKHRVVELPVDAVTSAIRYQTGGWWLRPIWNVTLISLYFLGLSPRWVARLYD